MSNKRRRKKRKANKVIFGFTLIELLAVIIILGILLLIAVPSVSTYISDSRKDSYILTAQNYIRTARNSVNDGTIGMYDTDTTYYIPVSCIKLENAGDSPYGEFSKAYVMVSYDGDGYDYYWASTDTAKIGILHTKEKDLSKDLIKNGVEDIDTSIALAPDSKVAVMDSNTCTLKETENASSITILNDNNSPNYIIETNPVLYDFSNRNSYIVSNNGSLNVYPLETIYNNFWKQINGKTIETFLLYNDNNLQKHAEIHIKMPKVVNKETGQEVGVKRWYYEMSIDYINKEIWTCTGTGNEEYATCTPKENYVATSYNSNSLSNYRFMNTINLYLEDGSFVKVEKKYRAFGYFVYRVGSYNFPSVFVYGTDL